MKLIQLLSPDGKLAKGYSPQIPAEVVIRAYQTMVLTRSMDERMITLQRQGEITFAMSSRGEECCSVASAAALELSDWMYPQYRESGVMFWRGASPQEYIHHMFGDCKDPALGRQMPNHFGSRKLNIVTVSSPIGTKIPHAAGCAYAMKLQKERNVAICYFGEGATSEGDFHSGLRFGAVFKAPVIFFCRNNGWAISTPCSSQFATEGVSPEGIGHGLATFKVDGNDFFAVYETTKEARKLCLEGKGPVFIEAMTYRLGAHSTSDDPTRYRSENELKQYESLCPILRLGEYLQRKKLWDKQSEENLKESIKKQIDEAIEIAKKTPEPPLESLIKDVYFQIPEPLNEQLRESLS
jgi:2-oxoisovalerate dehydrogenase E1 component alpha subunit